MEDLSHLLERIPPENRHRLDEKLYDLTARARIARSLGSWKVLAQYLPNIESDIEGIEYDNRTLELQKIALLQKWLDRNGRLATYRQLARCLYEARAMNTLDILCAELGATTETCRTAPSAKRVHLQAGHEGHSLQDSRALRQRTGQTQESIFRQENKTVRIQTLPIRKTIFTLMATVSILAVLTAFGIYFMLPVHVPPITHVSPGLVSNDENDLPPDSFHFGDENRIQYA